jgi:membrane protein DedA with SNARE-associated domain
MIAAVCAGAGRLNLAAVAAVAGDNVGYAVGRFGGHRLIARWGRYVMLTPPRVAKAEAFFARHDGKVVTVARFIEGLRQANGIIAGLTEMPWLRFLAFNALGAALWVGVWVTVGDLAGQHNGTLYPAITRYELYLLAAVAVLIAVVVVHRLRRGRKEASESAGEPRPARDPRP